MSKGAISDRDFTLSQLPWPAVTDSSRCTCQVSFVVYRKGCALLSFTNNGLLSFGAVNPLWVSASIHKTGSHQTITVPALTIKTLMNKSNVGKIDVLKVSTRVWAAVRVMLFGCE